MSKSNVIDDFRKALQKKDVDIIHSEGERLLEYLKIYSGSFKPNGLLSKILLIDWQKEDVKGRDKAVAQAARNYISYFLTLIDEKDKNLEVYISNIQTGLADFKTTICRLDNNLKFNSLWGNTNVQQTGIQFKIVESLYYKNSLPERASKYDLEHLMLPFLRTILESKIKSIIGIDILRNSKNAAIDISEILDILPNLKAIKLHKAYDPNILKLIMKWLNHFMHRNLRPEVYILFQVIQYLEPIFQSKKITYESNILFSINSSAFASDETAYHSEVENILNIKFPDCFIQWKRKEIATIRKGKTSVSPL